MLRRLRKSKRSSGGASGKAPSGAGATVSPPSNGAGPAANTSDVELPPLEADSERRLRHPTLTRPKQSGKNLPTRKRYNSTSDLHPSKPGGSPSRSATTSGAAGPASAAAAAAAAAAGTTSQGMIRRRSASDIGEGAAAAAGRSSLASTQLSADGSVKKIGHRKVDKVTGEVAYKKVKSSALMNSIQLGIRISTGYAEQKKMRDLLQPDFYEVESLSYPKEGSSSTPPHHHDSFKFYSYAPRAFRFFRDAFGINTEDFLLSLCDKPLRELSNPGASGSVFYLSGDDQFIIKTVQKREHEFLLRFFPGYYMNLVQNRKTLLPKFFGLFNYQSALGSNIRFVIMNNLLPSSLAYYERYDLKGSTLGRFASSKELQKKSPTLKDLDFENRHPEGLMMEPEMYEKLSNTIRRDAMVLESFKIMDYSLLVGLHRPGIDENANDEIHRRKVHDPNGPSVHQMSIQKVPSREHSSLLAPSISAPEGNMTEHTTPAMHVDGFEGYATYLNGVYCEQANMFGSTNIYKLDGKVPTGYGVMSGSELFLFLSKEKKAWVISSHLSDGPILAFCSGEVDQPSKLVDTWQVQTLDKSYKEAVAVVVTAIRKRARDSSDNASRRSSISFNTLAEQISDSEPESDSGSGRSVMLMEGTPAGGLTAYMSNGERVVMYIGIIDILQSYQLKKKLEHGLKSIIHDGDTVSVHNPKFYANRFTNFMLDRVFQPNEALAGGGDAAADADAGGSKKKAVARRRGRSSKSSGSAAAGAGSSSSAAAAATAAAATGTSFKRVYSLRDKAVSPEKRSSSPRPGSVRTSSRSPGTIRKAKPKPSPLFDSTSASDAAAAAAAAGAAAQALDVEVDDGALADVSDLNISVGEAGGAAGGAAGSPGPGPGTARQPSIQRIVVGSGGDNEDADTESLSAPSSPVRVSADADADEPLPAPAGASEAHEQEQEHHAPTSYAEAAAAGAAAASDVAVADDEVDISFASAQGEAGADGEEEEEEEDGAAGLSPKELMEGAVVRPPVKTKEAEEEEKAAGEGEEGGEAGAEAAEARPSATLTLQGAPGDDEDAVTMV